jgi:antitoxin MazE
MQVAQWGNSLAVRLPAALVQDLGLRVGQQIDFQAAKPSRAANDAVVLTVKKQPTNREILDSLRHLMRPLPADYKFDRDEANAR